MNSRAEAEKKEGSMERQYGGLDRDDAHEHQDEMDARLESSEASAEAVERRERQERRELQAKRLDTGEQVGRGVDVTGQSENQIARITSGMLINLHPDLFVDDVTVEVEE